MIGTGDQAAHLLYQYMLTVFDEVDAEDGKEWVLWDSLARWWSSRRGHYQPPSRFPQDVTDHVARLDELFREADGWIWWVRNRRGRVLPRFVPKDRWLWLVALRGEQPHLTNEQLHEMFPADPSPAVSRG